MAATFRRRFRRGTASTAVAALALAALTASQSPGAASPAGSGEEPSPPSGTPIDGGSSYYTDLPPRNGSGAPGGTHRPGGTAHPGGTPTATGPAEAGIPATVLDAYKKAQARLDASDPGCRLPWQLLAAIGKVESGQANGGAVDARGTTLTPIRGPQLNGNGFALIPDTDQGRLDGDTTHDRAVGPMQFIPSTWSQGGPDGSGWGADGNGDGKKDPDNVYDAALAAGRYLCNGGRDLSTGADRDRAILGYNHSQDYLNRVLSWFTFYRNGTHEVPDGKGVLPVHRGGGGRGHAAGPGGGRHLDRTRNSGGGHSAPGGQTPGGHGRPTPAPGTKPPHTPAPQTPSTPPSKPPTKPPTTPPTKPPTKPAPAPLTALERLSAPEMTATAGTDFADPVRVRAKNAAGKPVAGVRVRYEIAGRTEARFPKGATHVTVTTGADGTAAAPTISAGGRAGDFTVRATAEGRQVPAAEVRATVRAKPVPVPTPKADALTRTSSDVLTAEAGGTFAAGAVEIKATYHGKAAAGVAVTATMVTDDPKKPTENDKGPYFKAAAEAGGKEGGKEDGKDGEAGHTAQAGADQAVPVRTLTLKTDAHGLLKLPKIYTDRHTGTFLLRLTTADGAVLTVKLNVTAPASA
ncbi:lytic transglycosylase [Streptomyces sp. MST-110588]|uniref:lytic transglycosylase domain-containing protein n=1 Tax=Streptomyces sp. MST-110588 TaxID=2833628 RepID=UPI001F5DEEF0|nr:lytic transglycosylase [Streptomyces sp. MST-110588]UNO42670.1 lytic transglycosylase [Streptomyces sp. MST-110588]